MRDPQYSIPRQTIWIGSKKRKTQYASSNVTERENSDQDKGGSSKQGREQSDQGSEQGDGNELGYSDQESEQGDVNELGYSDQESEQGDGNELGYSDQEREQGDGNELGYSDQETEEGDGNELGYGDQEREQEDCNELRCTGHESECDDSDKESEQDYCTQTDQGICDNESCGDIDRVGSGALYAGSFVYRNSASSLCTFASSNNEEDPTLNIESHFGISSKLVRLTTQYWF